VHAVCSGFGRPDLEHMLVRQAGSLMDKGEMQGQELAGYVPKNARLSIHEQVVDAVLSLCSQAAAHVTGQVIYIEGKQTGISVV